jgi:hypothetical protein
LLLALTAVPALAQRQSETAKGGVSTQVQPKIMVIPYARQGEDILKVLEADFNRRVAVAVVREAFDTRNFSTVDFAAVVKGLSQEEVMQATSQSGVKELIVAQSQADVYVEIEVQTLVENSQQRVSLIMTARLAATHGSLANKTQNEGPYAMNVPMERIVQRAVATAMEPFLGTMQTSFSGHVAEGVPVRMEISVANGAKDLTRPVGPNKDELADAIEEWFEKNAYHNNYSVGGRTNLRMSNIQVRIPLFDPETKNNYNASRFSLEFNRFLRTIDVRANRSLVGGVIYVEIQ